MEEITIKYYQISLIELQKYLSSKQDSNLGIKKKIHDRILSIIPITNYNYENFYSSSNIVSKITHVNNDYNYSMITQRYSYSDTLGYHLMISNAKDFPNAYLRFTSNIINEIESL